MKKPQILRLSILLGFALALITSSCTDKSIDEEIIKLNKEKYVLRNDFDLNHEPINASNTNSRIAKFDNYSYFGEGYDALKEQRKESIFKEGTNIESLIETLQLTSESKSYAVSTSLSEIQSKVEASLNSSTNYTGANIPLRAALNVYNFANFEPSANSVYFYILDIYNEGYGKLGYWDAQALNPNLRYKTTEQIPLNNTEFRALYGDKFISKVGVGIILSAVVQIANIEYTRNESKDAVNDAALDAFWKAYDTGMSWEKATENDDRFSTSQINIKYTLLPHGSGKVATTPSELAEEYKYTRQLMANEEYAAIWFGYEPFSTIYHDYSFFNITEYLPKKSAWIKAKETLEEWRSMVVKNESIYDKLTAEIEICEANIEKLEATISVDYPSSYSALFREIRESFLVNLYQTENGNTGNYTLYLADAPKKTSDMYLGKAFSKNWDPEYMQPIFEFNTPNTCYGKSIPYSITNHSTAFYTYRSSNATSIPIFRSEASTGYTIYRYNDAPWGNIYPSNKTFIGFINQ
jgi:hypothetical protein